MKVRCVRLIDALGRIEESSAWLTIGKIYAVLSVVQNTDFRWSLRLMGDDPNGVALFPLEQFEIITNTISPTWIVSWDGCFSLGPAPWDGAGFWNRYYDRDPDALRIFDEEHKKIVESDL